MGKASIVVCLSHQVDPKDIHSSYNHIFTVKRREYEVHGGYCNCSQNKYTVLRCVTSHEFN